VSSAHWDFDDELELTEEQRATLHERVQSGTDFRALRRRMRGFAFPMAAAFLLWYLAFVLLASYARDLMATPVLGGINLGLVVGLAQFATTFALTAGYVRYARRRLDPLAAQLRDEIESRTTPVDRVRIGAVRVDRAVRVEAVPLDAGRVAALEGVRVGSAR
jgi:uncharacterized membrane protein (DUF485 family)